MANAWRPLSAGRPVESVKVERASEKEERKRTTYIEVWCNARVLFEFLFELYSNNNDIIHVEVVSKCF
jgi:hypothetical protein